MMFSLRFEKSVIVSRHIQFMQKILLKLAYNDGPQYFTLLFPNPTFSIIKYIEKDDITKLTTILCMLHPANTIPTNHNRFTARLLYASLILLLFFLAFHHSSYILLFHFNTTKSTNFQVINN